MYVVYIDMFPGIVLEECCESTVLCVTRRVTSDTMCGTELEVPKESVGKHGRAMSLDVSNMTRLPPQRVHFRNRESQSSTTTTPSSLE